MCTSIECYYKGSKRITTARAKENNRGDQSELSMNTISGKRCSLIVSTLNSMLRGPCLRPGWGNALCSWARHFTVTVPP